MSSHNILVPSKPKIVKEEGNLGVYEIDGLYPGYGHTLGNSLRRIILSSIPGAAITSLSIDGVKHEFSTIEGVKEDVIAMILNLKKVKYKVHTDEAVNVKLKVKGPKVVTAADIEAPSQIEIVNKDQYICEITGKTEINLELNVEKGLGYMAREELQKDRAEIGTITLDAAFTPIRRASYEVENMRVGDRTDHNRLKISIETDGTVSPRQALEMSINTMITQLQAVVGFKESKVEEVAATISEDGSALSEEDKEDSFTKIKIETLGLSTRVENALISASIRTIGGVIRKSETDLLELDGLGEKGVQEIKRAISNYGVTLKSN